MQRKCEWESMSGRQLTISDTLTSDLSKVELDYLQRVAIARLQGMDISVSFGLLKGNNYNTQFRNNDNSNDWLVVCV